MAEPCYCLTKKTTPWKWVNEEQAVFKQLKNILSSDQVLVHFNSNKPLGLACDESNIATGAVLFHHCPDGSEYPNANESKTLMSRERNYSQIQMYQYLYRCPFILVTDHKLLMAPFGPKRETPLLTVNRLTRWVQ